MKYSFKEKYQQRLWLIKNWLLERYFEFKKAHINAQNKICVLPWISLDFESSGKVHHCCMTSDYQAFAGDLTKQTIEEVWNSDYMKSLRKDMINGKEPGLCSKCYESERCSGNSARLDFNNFFRSKLKKIPAFTKYDGSVDKIELKYWDLHFSNLCNLKCRTCNPWSSSAWASDARKLGWLYNKESENSYNNESFTHNFNIDFIKGHVDIVKWIYFSGGEPLIMDKHWEILEMLDKRKKYNVVLSYNTNLSTLKYKNKNVLDYWSKWGRHVWLWPSIDEIDERAELIRSGTNWKKVEENLKIVNNLGILVRPNITITAMNVFRITEILDHLIEIGVIRRKNENWQNFTLNIVTEPAWLHLSVLPDNVRLSVRKKMENYIINYKKKYSVNIRAHFLNLFWHLEKPWQKENGIAFKEFTNAIDKIRGENTLAIIPELQCIL